METPRDQQDRILSSVAVLCLIASLGFVATQAAPALTASSSYWLDEIFSVQLVDRNFFQMLLTAGQGDVHPPLYYSLLWLWSQVFGFEETATRSLSILSVAGTLLALIALRPKLSRTSFALVYFFILLNPLLYFYALEARSYALLAFLSTLTMVCAIRGWAWPAIFACAALGMTHYFGTLLALAVLARLAFRNPARNIRIGVAFAILVLFIWPLLQFTMTGLVNRTGGNFWIEARGGQVFSHALDATLPALSDALARILDETGGSIAWIYASAAAVFLLVFLFSAVFSVPTAETEAQIAVDTALIILVVVIAVFIISFHTPLATIRNFIVIVPQMCLVTAILCHRFSSGSIWRTALTAAVFVGYSVSSSLLIKEEIAKKVAPFENWREMAAVAVSTAEERGIDLGIIAGGATVDRAYNWYMPEDIEPLHFRETTDWATIAPSVLMFYGISCERVASIRSALVASNRLIEEIKMPQSHICGKGNSKNAVFVIGQQ